MKMASLFLLLLIIAASISLTGCYRMPTDDDFSIVPTTNNPSVTCEKQNNSLMPTVGM
jgi:hypothetical protein